MNSESVIHPGPNHISVFRFTGPQPRYRTLPRYEKPDWDFDPNRSSGDKDEKAGTDADQTPPVEGRGDEDWWRRVPGIVDTDRSVMFRAFGDLKAIEAAVPEIAAVARVAGGWQPNSPDFVLIAKHAGPLDAAQVFALGQDLGRAGIRATIVVDHSDEELQPDD